MFTENFYGGVDFWDAEILENELNGITFTRCSFRGADFAGIVLQSCQFDRCRFEGARFSGVDARQCGFIACMFQYADCFGAAFHDCKMLGTSFSGANIEGLRIDGGDWRMAALPGADFRKGVTCSGRPIAATTKSIR